MTDRRLTELSTITSVTNNDLLYVVDASDTGDSAEGSSRSIRVDDLLSSGASVSTIDQFGDNTVPGTTDMTAAFQSLLSSGKSELLIGKDNVLIDPDALNELSASDTVLRSLGGEIVLNSETGIGTGVAALTVSGSDNLIDLRFDMNTFGSTCVKVTGDRNQVKVIGKNGNGSASSNGDESLILCTGDDNSLEAFGYELNADAGPNGNVPRLITVQGNSVDNTITNLFGRNIVAGLVTASTTGILVEKTDLEDVEDNGLYILTGSNEITVDGGRINGSGEPMVIAGHDVTVNDMDIFDPISTIGLDGTPERITLNNVRMSHGDSTKECAFIGTRATHSTTQSVTLNNCTARINITNGGVAQFSVGTVNDFRVLGGYYELHWTDDSSGSTRIVRHSTGNEIHYQAPVIKLVDDKTTPLTGTDFLQLDLPSVSVTSTYIDVAVINATNGTVREGTVGAIGQGDLIIRSPSAFSGGGLYLSGLDDAIDKEFWGAGAPTAATWAVGDRVKNSAPSAGEPLGWVCTAAGTPGTWIPFGGIESANSYTVTNGTTDRSFDANAAAGAISATPTQAEVENIRDAVLELADVIGTVITDLVSSGVLKN